VVRAQGEDTPSDLETSEEEDVESKEEEEDQRGGGGGGHHLPILYHARLFPRLMTSFTSEQGSQLACPNRNGPEQRPGHRLAHRGYPTWQWYFVTHG
jgi:hypothetical protein